MGYKGEWFVQNRVLLLSVWGERTLEEMREGSAYIVNAVRNGSAPVHLIIDMQNVTGHPRRIGEVRDTLVVFDEPNLGWVVTITQNRALKFISDILTQMARKSYKSFDNPQDAVNFLWHIDPSLLQPIPEITIPDQE